MNNRIDRLGFYLVIICFIYSIIFAQDSTSIDSTDVTLPDSTIQKNDSTFLLLDSLTYISDSILITIDTLEIVIPKNQPPIFTKTDFKYLMKEDNELRIPLSFFNSFVEDPDDSLTVFNWRIHSGKRVDASMIDDSVYILPQVNWFGYDTLTLVVSDREFSANAHILMNVTPENDPPVFTSNIPSITMEEDGSKLINITEWSNYVEDTDNVDSTLTWEVKSSKNIAVQKTEQGFIITPQSNWFGGDSLDVFVSDGEYVDTTFLIINILAVNDPPYFKNKLPELMLNEDQIIGFPESMIRDLITDIDNVTDSLKMYITDGKMVGHQQQGNTIRLIPLADKFGVDTIKISITDGEYLIESFIFIKINPVNDSPRFSSLLPEVSFVEDADHTLEFKIWNSFVKDIDNSNKELLWTIQKSQFIEIEFSETVVRFKSQDNWFGNEKVMIVVSDGFLSDSTYLSINVLPENDPPSFTKNIPSITLNEDSNQRMQVSDLFDFIDDPDHVDRDLDWHISRSDQIDVEWNGDEFLIIPESNWFGKDYLLIIASDGEFADTTKLIIEILSVNDAPVFLHDLPNITFNEDNNYKIDFKDWFDFVNDIDNSKGELIWNIDEGKYIYVEKIESSITFSSQKNWFGEEKLLIEISDGYFIDSTYLKINVLPENDPPSFTKNLPSITLNEDTSIHIHLTDWFEFVEDPDNSDDNLIWLISSGLNVIIKRHGNVIDFQSKENWYGKENIPVLVWDGEYSDTSYITLHVLPINDPPIFTQKVPPFVMNEDQLLTINLSKIRSFIFDVDTQTDLLSISIKNSKHVSNIISQNSIEFVSSKNWYGEDSLVISISDGEYTTNNRLKIKVQPINDAPVFSESIPDTFMFEDNDLVIPIKNWFPYVTDVDNDDSQLIWEIMNTTNFKIQHQSELMTFIPKLNWNGYDKIKVVATDGNLSDTSEFVIRTIPINDPPSLFDFPDIEMIEDGVLELDLKLYMNDIDNDINELEWSFISDFQFNKRKSNINNNNSIGVWPFFTHDNNNQKKEERNNNVSFITVNKANQSAIIKPPENYFADNLSFIAKITDPRGGMDIAMFNITIKPENDAPSLNPVPSIKLNEDEIYKKSTSIWFPFVSDVDNPIKKLKWEIESQKNNIHYEIDKDSVTIYSDENWWGSDTVLLSVSDGEYVDKTELIVTVLPVNDPPGPFELINYSKSDSSKYTFFWFPTLDVEDDPIEYHFHLIGGRIDTVIHKIESTQFTFHGEKYFESNVSYKWFVEASDKSDTVRCVESFELIIQFIPRSFAILPNYPNPFNYNTIIPYDLPYESMVKVDILDINGKIIKHLVRQRKPSGRHQVVWEGRDRYARPVASGLYFVVMETGGKAIVRKIMYIK